MQGDGNDGIKIVEIYFLEVKLFQNPGQGGAGRNIASVFEPVDGVVNDAIISNHGAGRRKPRPFLQAGSAQMIPGRRVREKHAADRTETAGDESDFA